MFTTKQDTNKSKTVLESMRSRNRNETGTGSQDPLYPGTSLRIPVRTAVPMPGGTRWDLPGYARTDASCCEDFRFEVFFVDACSANAILCPRSPAIRRMCQKAVPILPIRQTTRSRFLEQSPGIVLVLVATGLLKRQKTRTRGNYSFYFRHEQHLRMRFFPRPSSVVHKSRATSFCDALLCMCIAVIALIGPLVVPLCTIHFGQYVCTFRLILGSKNRRYTVPSLSPKLAPSHHHRRHKK